MASLRELLTQEGFNHKKSAQFPKFKLSSLEVIKPLPLYICHDRKSPDCSKHKAEKTIVPIQNGSSSFQSKTKTIGSASDEISNSTESADSRKVGPPMDEVAVRAVIAILSGYIGRYIKDDYFRKTIRDKCNSYLVRRRNDLPDGNGVLANMKMGMDNIDKLVEDQGTKKQLKIKSLRNSIELLTIVAFLNSKTSRKASTCGIPNSHLSACAQLYLAIVYKLQKNNRICARHLLQAFCDSPFLARTNLLPELWEHLFLPHLLHLKIWYTKELHTLSDGDRGHAEKEKEMKSLSRVYNDKVDMGTTLFALYYKQWLKVGATEPPLPIVPLPSTPSYTSSRRNSSSTDSFVSHSSTNSNLYKAVFGSKLERIPTGVVDQNGVLTITWVSEKGEQLYGDEYNCSLAQKEDMIYLGRSSSSRQIDAHHAKLRPGSQRLDYFQCFSCRTIQTESSVDSVKEQTLALSSDFVAAITTICSSNILSECEFAMRLIAQAWLNSHGDPLIEEALTQSSVIEAILEVLFASNEDEILEFAISVLAELVGRNDAIRQIILNWDPQLEIFVRLFRRTSLFLKAAVLLYLSKPQAKHMLSPEWMPLVLRVLEFGDKLQTLFTVQCSPQVAALYFIHQLLTGFDEDKNFENARQVVSLGGLTLLMRTVEEGEAHDRNNAALVICCCIRAEGSCRSFLAVNINKTSLLELIVLGNNNNSSGCAFSVLAELLYLERTTKIFNFLRELKDGWGGLNTMHILFIYLERAPPEERPLVAMILLLLDLMEDPYKGSSLYRAEAIEAVVTALNCQMCNDIIQEQSARVLLLLAGHFSDTGESLMEKWLLQKAGFQEDCLQDSFHGKEIVVYDLIHKNKEEEDEEAAEIWRKKAACLLFKSGNKNLLWAMADSVGNGIPSLARASLITISWMSSYLQFVEDRTLPPMAFSIFMPQLLKSLNDDKDVEERVLASYASLCLVKNSGPGCVSVLASLDKDSLVRHLQNLSLVTWTANELISVISKTYYY